MSRFYVKAKGDNQQSTATRGAQEKMKVTVNGWDIGVTVEAWKCTSCGKDRFEIMRNGGSNGSRRGVLVTWFCEGCDSAALAAAEIKAG